MLDTVIDFFRTELENYLISTGTPRPAPTQTSDDTDTQLVVFPKMEGESIEFHSTKLNMLIVNLEEESTARQADVFRHKKDGVVFSGPPEIRLNLYILFVAVYKSYTTNGSLQKLSRVIRFFQARRVFDTRNTPQLPAGIEKLTAELLALPFAEQNEVWNALRTSYKPSLLYKVRMVVFSPEPPAIPPAVIKEINNTLSDKPN